LVALTHPFAQAHERAQDGRVAVNHAFVYNTILDPSSGAISCVADLANLAQMYLHQGLFQQRHGQLSSTQE
jgi:hypothetical protein